MQSLGAGMRNAVEQKLSLGQANWQGVGLDNDSMVVLQVPSLG